MDRHDLDPAVNRLAGLTDALPKRFLSARRFAWPAFCPRPVGGLPYTLRTLRDEPDDFAAAAQVFIRGYPQLYGTGAQVFFEPDAYPELLAGPEGFMTGRGFILVAADASDRPAGAVYLKADAPNLAVFWALTAVLPEHRRGLLAPMARAADEVTAGSGAEYAFSFAVTFHRVTQRALARVGFVPRGLLPGAFLAWSGGDVYHRETVLYMDKLYGGAESVVLPDARLIPEARWLSGPAAGGGRDQGA